MGKIRFFYFVTICRRLKTLDSKDAVKETVKHNLKALAAFGGTRMELLIKPLSVLESVPKNAKILVIGPRNEDDILNLIGHGFQGKNITGLDLISYSPFIELGDMHNTRFENSFFDVILCGWTLSYSNEPMKFATETLRILKNDGVIGIGVEYSKLTEEQSKKLHGGYDLHTNYERINSTKQILSLYQQNVKEVYFDHDAPNKVSHGDTIKKNVSNVATLFSVKKQ